MMHSKKGVELPMNTVIVAVIAILILVVLAAIFLGGTTGVWGKLQAIFSITTGGKAVGLAQEECRLACVSARASENPMDSYYCTHVFEIDDNNDGKVEPGEEYFVCARTNYNQDIVGAGKQVEKTPRRDLGVLCPEVDCRQPRASRTI